MCPSTAFTRTKVSSMNQVIERPTVFYVVAGELKYCVQYWSHTLKGSIDWNRMIGHLKSRGGECMKEMDLFTWEARLWTGQSRGEFIGSLSANICVREEFDLLCMSLTGRFKEADI